MKIPAALAVFLLAGCACASNRTNDLQRRVDNELPSDCVNDACMVAINGCGQEPFWFAPVRKVHCSAYVRDMNRLNSPAAFPVTSTTILFLPPPPSPEPREIKGRDDSHVQQHEARQEQPNPKIAQSSSSSFIEPTGIFGGKLRPQYAERACDSNSDYESACSCMGITTAPAATSSTAAAAPLPVETLTLYAGCVAPDGCLQQNQWLEGDLRYTCRRGVEPGTSICYERDQEDVEQGEEGEENGRRAMFRASDVDESCQSHKDCRIKFGFEWGCVSLGCEEAFCRRGVVNTCDKAPTPVED